MNGELIDRDLEWLKKTCGEGVPDLEIREYHLYLFPNLLKKRDKHPLSKVFLVSFLNGDSQVEALFTGVSQTHLLPEKIFQGAPLLQSMLKGKGRWERTLTQCFIFYRIRDDDGFRRSFTKYLGPNFKAEFTKSFTKGFLENLFERKTLLRVLEIDMSWATYHIKKLLEGETVEFRPRGHSMSGLIESGELVRVEPCDDPDSLNVGDIVLCKVRGRDYLHKITSIDDNRVLISNNRGHDNGWTHKNKIFGVFVEIVE